MGVDPGLASTGIAFIQQSSGRLTCLHYSVIATSPREDHPNRLLKIKNEVKKLIQTWKPTAAGLESLYFSKKLSTAIPIAEARGVVLLTLAEEGVAVREFSPPALKQGVTGNGRSDKLEVQTMVKIILGLGEIPRPDHAADALAAAIACAQGGLG